MSNYIDNRREWSMMAQFRSEILPLEIETGRYRNVQADERDCLNCRTLVETELQISLVCPLYDEAR